MQRFMAATEKDFNFSHLSDRPKDPAKWKYYTRHGDCDLYVRRVNDQGWPLMIVGDDLAGRIERECGIVPARMKHTFMYAVYANPEYKHPHPWVLRDGIEVNGKLYSIFSRVIDAAENEEYAAAPLAEGNPPPHDVIVGHLSPAAVRSELENCRFQSCFLYGDPGEYR